MRLAAVDARAAREGLRPGQNLSDAKAQVPNLEVREIDHAYVEHVFADFADWHSNASPLVAVLADRMPYGDLGLDITGTAHLFGGEAPMLATLTSRLADLGFTVRGAIADTIGAAWALAHYAPGTIASTPELPEVLASLPVAALRLDEAQVLALSQLGLKQVGQLYGRDRKALQARFGTTLVTRLDQALGRIEERLTPRIPVTEHFAERRFAEPIGLIDDVLVTAEDLAVQLGYKLEAKGLGAQSFHLFLYLVDHKVISLSVNASRPTRDAGHIGRLFKHRAERLAGEYDPGFGIDLIRLGASSVSELLSRQVGAFGSDTSEDLEKLFDRMTSRLGPLSVVRSKSVNSHIPEQAIKLEPVVARTPDDTQAAPDPTLRRPLRLLPVPEPITVTLAEVPDGPPPSMIWRRIKYRFVKTSGPERISAEWWQSAHGLSVEVETESPKITITRGEEKEEKRLKLVRLPIPSRDYFIAEDEKGRRFWLFRDGLYGGPEQPRWYVHGFFA
jgi:protein ImuB